MKFCSSWYASKQIQVGSQTVNESLRQMFEFAQSC